MTTTPPMSDAIVDFIRLQGGHVSFVEVRDFLRQRGIDTEGTFSLDYRPNTLLWLGMSEPFVDVMADLLLTKRIKATPTSLLVYLVDGGVPQLPLARRITKRGYTKPHWLPVVFDVA